MLYNLFAFLIGLAILITVHEYGHFIVARWCGVKVLRFSIGFGKPLWLKKCKSGMEFVIAMIPFGGYVKMLDEREGPVAEAEQHLAFNKQKPWKRIAIASAGPLFNIFFAIFAFWLMFVIGITSIAPVIGKVATDSIVQTAGLQRGDEIISVNGKQTENWRAVQLALMSHFGTDNDIAIKTKNIDDSEIKNITISIANWDIEQKRPDLLKLIGVSPYLPDMPAIVAKVMADSPAAKAGFEVGDKIIAVDGKPMEDWLQFLTLVRDNEGQAMQVEVERDAGKQTLTVTPQLKTLEDGQQVAQIGIQSPPVTWPKQILRLERYSIFAAWLPALKETNHLTLLTFKLLGKMVVGDIPLKNISGPIGIAIGAGQSASLGFTYYISFLALISISLAVLNILPIPILDGGHILFDVIELISRRPVTVKARELGYKLGFILIFMLIGLAVFNDIMRLL